MAAPAVFRIPPPPTPDFAAPPPLGIVGAMNASAMGEAAANPKTATAVASPAVLFNAVSSLVNSSDCIMSIPTPIRKNSNGRDSNIARIANGTLSDPPRASLSTIQAKQIGSRIPPSSTVTF